MMSRRGVIFLVILLALAGLIVFSVREGGWRTGDVCRQKFADFPAATTDDVNVAPVDFDSYPEARVFETVIKNGAAEGPNFAGHYTIITWSCGGGCQSSAIIDAPTGKIVTYGLLSTQGLAYQLDSRLLIVNPVANWVTLPRESLPANLASEFYVLDDDQLSLTCAAAAGERELCAAVVTRALQPLSGEIGEFATPCEVPIGWQVLSATTP